MSDMPNINANERRTLRALYAGWDGYGGFCFSNFGQLSRRSRLKRAEVRKACRSLTRKGLAEFSRALFTEDGEVAGSGYACTMLGAAIIEAKRR